MNSVSEEIYWLTLTIIMTASLWIPYIINRIIEHGALNAFWDPFGDTSTNKAWAQRMMNSHYNAVENLVIFAPLVILVQIYSANTNITATACMIYFFARLIHYVSYTFAIPFLRVVTFLAGYGMQLILALTILDM